jgi:hypothetical protein
VVVVASEPGLTRDSWFDGYAFYYLGEGNKYGSSLIEACQRRSQQKPAGWGAEAWFESRAPWRLFEASQKNAQPPQSSGQTKAVRLLFRRFNVELTPSTG